MLNKHLLTCLDRRISSYPVPISGLNPVSRHILEQLAFAEARPSEVADKNSQDHLGFTEDDLW